MKLNKFLVGAALTVIALSGASALPSAANAAPVAPRIVGGGSADFSSVPFTAKLLKNGAFNCTSEVISSTWVLTAKHCVGGTITIKVGSTDIDGGTELDSSQVVTWDDGDLALVELAQPTDTPTATLGSTTPSIGATGNIYGWGRETPTGPASPVLKTASVKVTGYGRDNAGGPSVRFNGISGSCWKGDSGGPLIVGGKVVGVASTSSNGGSNPQGACDYVDVAKGLSWIKGVAGL